MIILGVILVLYLKVHPKDAGLTVEETITIEENGINYQITDEREEMSQGIGFWEAFQTPGIIKYSLVFACIKSSAYGLLFWLPDYLHSIMGFGAVKNLL